MGDEGGLAMGSLRFLFTFLGQEYVWMRHRKFAGDNISCQNLSTSNVIASYTNKMLPMKLQGILVIEPQVCQNRHRNTCVQLRVLLANKHHCDTV